MVVGAGVVVVVASISSINSISSISSIGSIGSYHTDVLVISVEYEKVQKGGGEMKRRVADRSSLFLLF